jgi:hypothetical protein
MIRTTVCKAQRIKLQPGAVFGDHPWGRRWQLRRGAQRGRNEHNGQRASRGRHSKTSMIRTFIYI